MLEGLPAPLIRALGPEMGRAAAAVHARNGVEIRCDVRVEAIETDGDRVSGVRLAGGEVVPADVVVVGIGAAPVTGWLAGSGLAIGDGPGKDGVWCDATLNAGADPGPDTVFAAGDIAALGAARADGPPRALDERQRAGRVRRPQRAPLRHGR